MVAAMTTTATAFLDIHAPTPDLEALRHRNDELLGALGAATSVDACLAVLEDWDAVRQEVDTWGNLVHLRFNQDTTNADYKAALEFRDEFGPQWTELEVALKRAFLDHPLRAEVQERVGAQAFALWEVDALAFDPALKEGLVKESRLEAEYTELLAGAELDYMGETLSLSTIMKYRDHSDREVRHGADGVLWEWFGKNGEALDRIYDDLVKQRTELARTLGHDDFIELGYKRMARVDYDREAVDGFRKQIRDHVVPLATELVHAQAKRLGLSPSDFMAWDEAVMDPQGNPKPKGDHDWMLERAQEMFDGMGSGLGEFFRLMNEGGYLDLKSRDGKAGGGFCTSFPTHGMPFVYANFNGTKGDVEVFTHEIGHAFQCYTSRHQKPVDYLWPTMESCEIHSMSLEFLTWPHMERFFEDDAERFRNTHLTQSLLFLPYGVAVDHFQHEVYSRPEATPAERHAMWLEIERMYQPWKQWGDLAHPAKGGRWQLQRHIYAAPFYYIDYVLAQTCALQFLARARDGREQAMADYVALCGRGGEAPFQDLARSAGIRSPFDAGCLEAVVDGARSVLGN